MSIGFTELCQEISNYFPGTFSPSAERTERTRARNHGATRAAAVREILC